MRAVYGVVESIRGGGRVDDSLLSTNFLNQMQMKYRPAVLQGNGGVSTR